MNKTTTIARISFVLVAVLGLGAAGCSKKEACDNLAAKLCDGKDVKDCKKTSRSWIDAQMSDGDKKASGDEADMVCQLVLDEQMALDGWKEQFTESLAK